MQFLPQRAFDTLSSATVTVTPEEEYFQALDSTGGKRFMHNYNSLFYSAKY